MRRILLVIVIVGSANRGLGAQVSPADSAAVLLAAAQELLALGEERSFEAVLQLIISRFPDTPAGREAAGVLDEFRGTLQIQSGRTALTVWSTIYGTWLGVAIPAALGADDPSPYGAGLLIGAPLGFFASRAYATGTSMSSGQAGIIIFGSWWGTYQGLGWYQVANSDGLGSDESVFAAMVVGGLAGMGAMAAVARSTDISPVTSAMVTHGALWGSWYGFAAAVVADFDESGTWATGLLSGNVGAVLGAVTAPKVPWTSGQVRLISIAGFAGLVAGFGIDLLAEVDDEKTAIIIPTAGATIGLLVAGYSFRGPGTVEQNSRGLPGGALLQLGAAPGFDIPLPIPSSVLGRGRDGALVRKPAIRFDLLRVSF